MLGWNQGEETSSSAERPMGHIIGGITAPTPPTTEKEDAGMLRVSERVTGASSGRAI